MSVAITQKLIATTTTAVQADRKRRELIDAKAAGLILRIGPRGAKWSWKVERLGRTQRLELGPLSEWSIDEARALATEASGIVKSKLGFPTPEWLLERRMRYGKVPRPIRAVATSPMEFARYDFDQARAAYLAHVERTRRGDTHRDYAQLLGIPELEALADVKVARISRRQMSGIVEAIHVSGTERKAEKVAGAVRTMWTFLATDNEIGRSGVERGEMAGLMPPERTLRERGHADPAKGTTRKYIPPMLEVGRILAIARSGAFDARQSAAIQLLVFTVQRRRAIVSPWVEDLEDAADGAGLWHVAPANRKRADGDESHTIPLVPAVYAVMKSQAKAAAPSRFLFPQYRVRRRGGRLIHMGPEVMTRALLMMPGVEASPHDLRRAFGTHGEKLLGIPRQHTKMILDHGEGATADDVTGTSYALHDGTHIKWPIVRKWSAFVETFVQPAIDADPRLLDVAWLKAEIHAARLRIAGTEDDAEV